LTPYLRWRPTSLWDFFLGEGDGPLRREDAVSLVYDEQLEKKGERVGGPKRLLERDLKTSSSEKVQICKGVYRYPCGWRKEAPKEKYL